MAQQLTAVEICRSACLVRMLRAMRIFGIRDSFLGMHREQRNGNAVYTFKLASRVEEFPIHLDRFLHEMRRQGKSINLVELEPGQGSWQWEATLRFPENIRR